MRGPVPETAELKLLKGERADRMPAAPPAGLAALECPSYLDDDAREEWGRITGILARQGTLREPFGPLIEVYCDAHSLWLAARRELSYSAENGLAGDAAGDGDGADGAPARRPHFGYGSVVCSTDSGGVKGNPAAAVMAKAWSVKLRILGELGLTPSSAGRLAPPAEAQVDELDDFRRRKPG